MPECCALATPHHPTWSRSPPWGFQMLRIKPNADCILRWRRMRDARDPAVDQAHKPQLAARMPKPCDAFERLNIKLAIPGQREVNLLGKGSRTSNR